MAAPIMMAATLNKTRFVVNTNIFIGVCQRCSVYGTSGKSGKTNVRTKDVTLSSSRKAIKISNAMKSYLENASKYQMQIQRLTEEYKTGKRHLANIMSVPSDELSDEDVQKAIQYLMPSGLTARKAKPLMLKAEEIIAHRKAPQFGIDGRPHHYLFYTGKPNFFELMHTAALKFENLRIREEFFSQETISNKHQEKIKDHLDSEWTDKSSLENSLAEQISDQDYKAFCRLMDYLLHHPLSKDEDTFISSYRKLLKPKLEVKTRQSSVDNDGRRFQISYGSRKSAKCKVTVHEPGTGKFDINGQDLFYFSRLIDREQIMFPLHLSGLLGKVDVTVEMTKTGGPTGEAGAVRNGLANALLCFVTQDEAVKLQIAGLLTNDPRRRERKKPGKEGARKRYTWKKR